MAQRRFGPTHGAGVSVTEREAEKTIQPGALGVTGYYGAFEKGAVGELIPLLGKKSVKRRIGGRIPESLAPDATEDFFELGQGAGNVWAVRVTDGTEVQSELEVFTRSGLLGPIGALSSPIQLGTLKAKNGGRWGGKFRVQPGSVDTIATDILATTIDTAIAMLEDEYVGGTVTLRGVTSKTFEIVSNDVAGIVTVSSDSDMSNDLAVGGDPTNKGFLLELANNEKALSVIFKDGEEKSDTEFGVDVFVDGALVNRFPNLATDPNSSRYWVDIINDDGANFEIEAVDVFAGAHTSATRPSNHRSAISSLLATTLDAQIISQTVVNTGSLAILAIGINFTSGVIRDTLTLTMIDATTFNIVSLKQGSLGAGVIATPVVAANDSTIGFNLFVVAGTPSGGEVVIIEVMPFEADSLIGGFLIPDEDNPLVKFPIIDNDHNSISIRTGNDLTTVANAGSVTEAQRIGDVSPDELDATSDNGSGFSPTTNNDETYTVEITLGGIYGTFTAKVTRDSDSIEVLAAQTFVSGVFVELIVTGVLGEGIEIKFTDAGASSMTVGDKWVITGVLPSRFLVEAAIEFSGGYDGLVNLADPNFLALMGTTDSPFHKLVGLNQGLVKLSSPGVTSTAVQKAGLELASALNYQWRVTIPSNIVDEIGAHQHINQTIGRSDYGVVSFPSFASVVDPQSPDGRLKLVDLVGAIQGREALVAKNFNGFHKAAAGTDVTLPNVIKLPTGDTVLNEEFLNPTGINVIKFKSGTAIIWGDRTISIDPSWKFKHQREQMSHYENILRESFDFIVFAINDPIEQPRLLVSMQSFFLPEFIKRALRGKNFSEAAKFKIDDENNTDATRNEGDLNMDITLQLADTVERFNITIGKAGIFDSVS